MSIVKHQGSPNWYYSFMYKGKTHFGSTKTTNKALAKKIEEEKRRQVIAQQELGQAEEITLERAIDTYLESKRHEGEYRHIRGRARKLMGKSFCRKEKIPVQIYGLDGSSYLHTIKMKDVQHLVSNRKKDGAANGTILYELGTLNQIIKFIGRLGYLVPEIDFATLKKDNAIKPTKSRIRYLNHEEERRLLAELDPANHLLGWNALDAHTEEIRSMKQDAYDFAIMLLDTGARHTEISELPWNAIDLKTGTINLYRPKVQNESLLCMTDRLRAVLERRFETRDPDHLFVFSSKAGGARNYAPRAFASACRRAGLSDVTFHTLRHTFCSRLVANGATLYEVQQIVGHTTPGMTQRYAHLLPNVASSKATSILNRLNE
jgi:integrase